MARWSTIFSWESSEYAIVHIFDKPVISICSRLKVSQSDDKKTLWVMKETCALLLLETVQHYGRKHFVLSDIHHSGVQLNISNNSLFN